MVTPTSLRYDLEWMLRDIDTLLERDRSEYEKSAQGDLFEIKGLIEKALMSCRNVEGLWGIE